MKRNPVFGPVVASALAAIALPMTGRSLLPLLAGGPNGGQERTTAMELLGKMAVRRGNLKLVNMPPPYGTGGWQLFDVGKDPGRRSTSPPGVPTGWPRSARPGRTTPPGTA